MKSIVDELKDANKRGVAPPQNWTHRAIEEIDGLKKANSDLARAAIEKPPYKEDLKCCGNCQWSISRNCKDWQRYRDCGSYPALDSYCDKWQYDGLSREEREGK